MSNNISNTKITPRGINHLGITVPDIDIATTFLKNALDAKFCYDALTTDDPPREGEIVERQLGLPKGAKLIKQRFLQIGADGPGLELFEVSNVHSNPPVKLTDYGLNHLSVYVDDIEAAAQQLANAGARMLSEVHGNSRYEDTAGNGSVYGVAPWGMLIELQAYPNGLYYPDNAEVKRWTPSQDKAFEKLNTH